MRKTETKKKYVLLVFATFPTACCLKSGKTNSRDKNFDLCSAFLSAVVESENIA